MRCECRMLGPNKTMVGKKHLVCDEEEVCEIPGNWVSDQI